MRRYLTYLVLLVIGVTVLAACGGDATEEPLPEARTLLEEASQKVQDAESFELEITLTGYPVIINVGDFPLPEDLPLSFDYAQGTFIAPDKLSADVQVSLGDLAATVELVAIGSEQYMRGILTQDRWLQEEIIPGFSPSTLLAPEGGIADALNSITELEMVGRKDLDGLEVYHLHGLIEAENVYSLTFGLIGTRTGALDIDVYILADDHTVEQVILHEPLPDAALQQEAEATAEPDDEEPLEPTIWTISLQGYDNEYTIEAPVLDDAGSATAEPEVTNPDGMSEPSDQ